MTVQRGVFARTGSARSGQHGGFVVGLVVGLLVGLAIALGVALYVTKVPVPFINKVPQRTAEQDAAEAEKNKNWDPNAPLSGKNAARPASGAPTGIVPPPAASAPAVAAPASSTRDPAAILADRTVPPAVKGQALPLGADPFVYFVQAGAYARTEEAEQQRAKLAILGFQGKLSEREQSGRTMYRVRIGPFDRKEDADAAKDKLTSASIEAALVRVQK
jgi:cell division protein FtsN